MWLLVHMYVHKYVHVCVYVCMYLYIQHMHITFWFWPTVKTVGLSELLSQHYSAVEVEASELIRMLTDAGMDRKQGHVVVWNSDSFRQSTRGLLAHYV